MIPPLQAPIQRRIGPPKVGTLPGSLTHDGALAQLGERLHGMQEVSGSIPLGSTTPPFTVQYTNGDVDLKRQILHRRGIVAGFGLAFRQIILAPQGYILAQVIATDRRANLSGSLWMVAAMAAFAVEDTFVKVAAQTVPIGQILILFGLGGTVLFAALARQSQQPLFQPDVISKAMGIRVLFEITGRLFYALAITLTPLSAATVILQATPLVVVAGAAVVFGERVGWRRWAAVFVGLIGVLVIIQPGTDSFSLLSVLAVVGMIGFAGRDLASRAAPATIGTYALGFYGFLAVTAAGVAFLIWQPVDFVRPDPTVTLYLVGAITMGVGAYSCLMKAMRTGEVSAVTPFRYSRLLFGIALGLVLFGERLTLSMVIGSGLIVVSGIFILWRSTPTRRAA